MNDPLDISTVERSDRLHELLSFRRVRARTVNVPTAVPAVEVADVPTAVPAVEVFDFILQYQTDALFFAFGFEHDNRIAWLRHVIRRLEELVGSLECPRRGPHVRHRI